MKTNHYRILKTVVSWPRNAFETVVPPARDVMCADAAQEAEMALVRRLEILERLVYGRSMSRFTDRREGAEALGARVEAIAKDVAIAEGGDNRDIAKLAEQGDVSATNDILGWYRIV